MAITATLLTSGSSTTDSTTFTTASISPTANRLVVIKVGSGDAGSAAVAPTSVVGAGLTFASINDQTVNNGFSRVAVWRALSASPGSGALTITFSATMESCVWIVEEYADVDTGGTNGSAAIVQSAKASGIGTTSGSVTLAAFGDAVNNAVSSAWHHSNNFVVTPEAGYTEITELNEPSWTAQLESSWKIGEDTTVTASWSAISSWGGICFEIKASSAVVTLMGQACL